MRIEREKLDKSEVIKNILNPDNLAFVGVCASKNPNYEFVHDLYFKLSKNRTFKIPVSFKSLYLITVFKIRRGIQNEAIKYYKK